MTDEELDALEETIPELAVKALNAATQRALASGHSVVMIVNDELVRIDAQGTTVLKKMPPRFKVTERIKRISP